MKCQMLEVRSQIEDFQRYIWDFDVGSKVTLLHVKCQYNINATYQISDIGCRIADVCYLILLYYSFRLFQKYT